jgi:hypothetical protein
MELDSFSNYKFVLRKIARENGVYKLSFTDWVESD